MEEWLAMDHDVRWASYREKVATMRGQLSDLPGIRTEPKYFTMDERLLDDPVNCMTVECPGGAARVEQVSADLLSLATPRLQLWFWVKSSSWQ
jgi:D-glucosaminate-6-phosphate ammonia-lyase